MVVSTGGVPLPSMVVNFVDILAFPVSLGMGVGSFPGLVWQ